LKHAVRSEGWLDPPQPLDFQSQLFNYLSIGLTG